MPIKRGFTVVLSPMTHLLSLSVKIVFLLHRLFNSEIRGEFELVEQSTLAKEACVNASIIYIILHSLKVSTYFFLIVS